MPWAMMISRTLLMAEASLAARREARRFGIAIAAMIASGTIITSENALVTMPPTASPRPP
ncbi:MAG TPA: hypothetical protein VG148_05170 [Pyrinomonadaceae bacterium]|nr:hypothetical protein [Pyrinomonadaceae bacterium]